MDASIRAPRPAAVAMSTNALPGQQPLTIPTGAGPPGVIARPTMQKAPWPQSACAEPLYNDHVRGLSASPSKPRMDPPSRGHKRSATGEIKSAVYDIQSRPRHAHGISKHSRTTSLDSTGNKIAELSAQLRARLSYAAAKVEQSNQFRRHGEIALSQKSITGAQNTTQSVSESRHWHNGSIGASHYQVPPSDANGSISQAGADAAIRISSLSQTPKLAPPVDIVTGDKLKAVRRRPNPNETNGTHSHPSAPAHRRHHSEQVENPMLGAISKWNQPVNSTPSRLKPNSLRAITPQMISTKGSPVRRRTPSQNALLMEKDAIETLMFMSSPENSGYHSSSRARKPSMSVSIEAQMAASTQNSSQGSNTSTARQMPMYNFLDNEVVRSAVPMPMHGHQFAGLEAQAGDEIDRLLDQMEVDKGSEAESHLVPYNFDLGSGDQSGSYAFNVVSK